MKVLIARMWYFSWILGLGFALAFSVINAMWYEFGGRGTGLSHSDQPLQGTGAATKL